MGVCTRGLEGLGVRKRKVVIMQAIIGGADGPTSVFIAGRKKKIPLKYRMKNRLYQWKSKRAAQKITAGAGTLQEVVAYAVQKYGAQERNSGEQMPMDFHVYEVNMGEGRLEMEVNYCGNIFGVSYSGKKKFMKQMHEIAKDLYLYYGVSEEDIKQKSQRYHSLLAILSM